MALFTPRRLLATAIIAIVLILVIHSTTTSSSQNEIGLQDYGTGRSRSYPPSTGRVQGQQTTIQDISSRPLRDRLRYYFPYEMENRFPAYIWQTWKVSPASADLSDDLRWKEATWTEKHPGFVHEVIVDDAALHLIKYLFASVPEIAEAYKAMPVPVLKADFFRYLILLARGGIYSDIDTTALKPASEWLPSTWDHATLGMVIGIEADPDRPDWKDWYARRIQFCQWTIQAKPGHPILVDVVATITDTVLTMQKKGELTPGKIPTTKSVMELTGPGVWTDTIFRYFNDERYFDFSARSSNVSVEDFFALTEHKRVGDVAVLPITSFSPGVNQMGAEGTDHPLAFVHHEFGGSWKTTE